MDTFHPQSSLQWSDKCRNERQIVHRSPQRIRTIVGEFEILQVLEKSGEVDDLSTGSLGASQYERSDSWQEVSKVSLNLRHEFGNLQVLYLEVMDIG